MLSSGTLIPTCCGDIPDVFRDGLDQGVMGQTLRCLVAINLSGEPLDGFEVGLVCDVDRCSPSLFPIPEGELVEEESEHIGSEKRTVGYFVLALIEAFDAAKVFGPECMLRFAGSMVQAS